MINLNVKLEPLTQEAFAPFGDVIEIEGAKHFPINCGTIERYHDLANLDIDTDNGGRAIVSIMSCNETRELPYQVKVVERHPFGSQAFFPLDSVPMIVFVAPAGDAPKPEDFRGFITNGRQGVNYRAGVWHMPLISDRKGQCYLIVDRAGPGHNCEELHFSDHVITLSN
ncbi:MAG: ureidoglycolate lyase [Gammaproteobacteria bacterium]|nr:ureidoglycolate lyase [Gammaproteobacteria bacterium]